MDILDLQLLQHWFDNSSQLIQRICVVVMAAYIAIRITWLRQALHHTQNNARHCLMSGLFFGILAIIGTHSGLIIDVHQNGLTAQWSANNISLNASQAIISFRDTMIMVAGLYCGAWTGIIAGLIAAIERYYLGGFVAMPSASATLLLGFIMGLIKDYMPHWLNNHKRILIVVIFGTLLQRLMIIALLANVHETVVLIAEISIPIAIVNIIGSLLFLAIMHDLENAQRVSEARFSELRLLKAQTEPHFFNNTLNSIKTLIRTNPESAATHLVKLTQFFNATRENVKSHSITIEDEIAQIQHYLNFQALRFPDKFSFTPQIDEQLLHYYVPTWSILTLIENALLHGRKGLKTALHIGLDIEEKNHNIFIRVHDDGCGIAQERLALLGKQIVNSARQNGSGTALYMLNETLKLTFGNKAKLSIVSQLNIGTTIILILPKESKKW